MVSAGYQTVTTQKPFNFRTSTISFRKTRIKPRSSRAGAISSTTSTARFSLSCLFLNLAASEETFARAINIPLQRDDFDSIRIEYTTMLQNQLAKGNNGLIKTKYLTFGIDADSIKAAKPRLARIETDILNNFKRLGVSAETLDGKARLAQLHGIFHMDEQLPFRFEWDWLPTSGLSTKDFIAPSSFEFRTGKQFRMGKKYGAVSFVQILAPELNDRMLADFLDMESSLIVSLHISSRWIRSRPSRRSSGKSPIWINPKLRNRKSCPCRI